jgi:holo-[acyl-carrier protein] synthase
MTITQLSPDAASDAPPSAAAVRVTAGVDIVEVHRLSALAAQPRGLAGVLTEQELSYCRTRRRPGEHIAARFAAKEAVLKALGTGLAPGMGWTDVEVVKRRGGRPHVVLHGTVAEAAAAAGLTAVDVSLSHTADLAIAHAVALWGSPAVSPAD